MYLTKFVKFMYYILNPMDEITRKTNSQADGLLKIKDIMNICLSNWYWFVISVAVCLAVATFYILKQQPVYSRTMTVLIKTSNVHKYSSSDLDQIISKEGISARSTKLVNEKIFLSSISMLADVVERGNFNVQYFVSGKMHQNILYGTTLPYKVTFLDVDKNANAGLTIRKAKEGYELTDFYGLGANKRKSPDAILCNLMDTVVTPLGRIVVKPSENFFGSATDLPIYVQHSSVKGVASSFRGRLSISEVEKDSDVLNITFNDISAQRAEDVLWGVINFYNEKWIEDRNTVAKSTSHFIEDRLAAIEEDLGSVDNDISSYKSRNLMPDIESASSMYMSQSNEVIRQIQDLENQISTATFIKNYVQDYSSKNQLIPSSLSGISSNISAQIASYNQTLLKRNSQIANSSETNPYIAEMDNTLKAMRSSIISSIDGQIRTLEAQAGNLRRQENIINRKIAESPNQAKYLLSVERQQKVKESLYLFLLQKREESELGQAFTASDTRIINPPLGSNSPVSPAKMSIWGMALLIGLCIPLVMLYLIKVTDTKIRTRQDLNGLSLPFLGEVPLKFTKKVKNPAKNVSKKDSRITLCVQNGKRDVINEAFRVLRTNLEFMSGSEKCSRIVVTSFNVGSGKSFISLNLSAAMSINGKKTLLVDSDLRHHSISSIVGMPKLGLSDYLAGRLDNINDVIVKKKECETLDVLPIGTVPPNPSELISSKRFEKVIEKLSEEYEYIIFDCPPVDIVADTQIVGKFANRTLFIVRSGLLDKSMLPDLESFYDEGKYKNLSVILNGTGSDGSLYNYRHGYQYSYKYGYSYYNKGYYNYIKDEDE